MDWHGRRGKARLEASPYEVVLDCGWGVVILVSAVIAFQRAGL